MFEIDCELDEEDTLSYQDSFKWYSYSRNKAYNYGNSNSSYNLDTTDLNLYGDTDDEEDGESGMLTTNTIVMIQDSAIGTEGKSGWIQTTWMILYGLNQRTNITMRKIVSAVTIAGHMFCWMMLYIQK